MRVDLIKIGPGHFMTPDRRFRVRQTDDRLYHVTDRQHGGKLVAIKRSQSECRTAIANYLK